jgi:membrane peptidoglycan carboxypeptidase
MPYASYLPENLIVLLSSLYMPEQLRKFNILYNSSMQRTPLIVNRRLKRRESRQRYPPIFAGMGCSLLVSLGVVAIIIFGGLIYTQLIRGLPSPLNLPLLIEPPYGILLQPTRLYDSSGQHLLLTLENPAGQGRRYMLVDARSAGKNGTGTLPFSSPAPSSGYGNFPPALIDATIAVVDPTFWSNPGFIWKEWNHAEPTTLTERLVSTLLLTNEEPGIVYNLRLCLLSAQITTHYGRVKILEWYLNTAQYGPLVYGADAAARVYFHKSATDLNLAEAAALAAIAEAPQLNPFDAPQITAEKQQQVIHSMLSLGFISADEAMQAAQAHLNLSQPNKPTPELAPSFTRLVLQELTEHYGKDRLERGGLRIRTSLDYDLQLQVNCTVKAQLQRVNQPASGSQSAQGEDCPAARLLPTLPVSDQSPTTTLTADVIVYDPHNGQILALAADPSRDSTHAVGSLVTPFIYLTAFTRGMGPGSLVWDIPSSIAGAGSLPGKLAANGQQGILYHGPVRIRTALANDYLTPAVQLLSQVGPENVSLTARQLGVASLDAGEMDNLLAENGTFESGNVSLLEMARAYGVFANQGILTGQSKAVRSGTPAIPSLTPITVLSVETAQGDLLTSCVDPAIDCSPQTIPALSSQLAYLITNVLSDETARWPAFGHPNPLEIGRPAGAKTGRTQNGATGWALGFIPQLLVGVWVGPIDENASKLPSNETAPASAAALWHAIIQYASRNLPPENWTAPPGIQTVQVCDPSGMLPTPNCPTVVNEVFLSGNEPTQPDDLYRIFHVNRETGRLATVFTPPELVEDRVYLVVPPQAVDWARSTNLPIPPDNYDVIYNPPAVPNVSISAPQRFATAAGKITIRGTADGDDFSFYRLQVGKGLNPAEWIQVSKDNSSAVHDGILGEWDTSGLNGLYALQLLVVHKDQRVETTILQLTIDNQTPQVHILHPAEGQTLKTQENIVVLEASAIDDLALARVEFYLDSQLVGTFYQAPFTLAWQVKPGSHKFVAKAIDLSGNFSQDSVTFSASN